MYRIILIFICFIFSCQPLNLPTETNKPVSEEKSTVEPILLEHGKVKEIQLLKGQLAHQVLEFPELVEGQFYIINLVALNDGGERLIRPALNDETGFSLTYSLIDNESDIPYIFETYWDQKGQDCAYIAFKSYQFPAAYLSIFCNFNNYTRETNALIEASLRISRIEEPELRLPDSLKPDDSYTGLFTEKNYEKSDEFYLNGFEDNNWYKLIAKADFTNTLFPDLNDNNFSTYMSYGYENHIFKNSNTHIYYFKPMTNSNPCSIRINGQIGVSYTLSLLKVTNSFIPDSYEPDNGPLSPNIDQITGIETQSLSHSFISSKESDWIQFTPIEWGVYYIDLIIEDSFYEPGLELNSPPSIDFEIIQPDGATLEYENSHYVPIGEEMPITMKNIINWNITPDLLSPWFIHLRYRSYGENPLPLEYSIRIHTEPKS